MEKPLNLWRLLPDFTNLSLPPQTAEQLSSLFVFVLMLVAVGFLIFSLLKFNAARIRVNWLQSHISPLTDNTVAAKILEIKAAAEQKKDEDPIGHLWLEFDETLIEVTRQDNIYLYNTIDAGHFFNSTTLASGITENRMIAAVPGFLTAIGVIGTFVGLQLGLAELNITDSATVSEMKSGVSHVINGAKIAFMTSVWGVALSVVFNFIEKLLEQRIRSKINALQSKIDSLFPRLSAESQLQSISDNSEQSRESLQGLAEKIGDKMQESLLQVSQGIQDSLETSLKNIMAPAINKLVDETSDGNQKALEGLLTQFMEGFGKQGEDQRVALDATSHKVNDAIAGMSHSIEALVNKMEVSQTNAGEREGSLVASISTQVSQLVESTTSQSKLLTQFAEEQLNNMSTAVKEREVAAALMDKTRNDTFVEQTDAMRTGTSDLLQRVEQSIENQQTTATQIVEQGKQLQQSVESSVHASAKATQSMEQTATELRNAADSMNVFSSHIRDAGNNLAGAVTSAVDSTKDLAQQNQLSVERMETLRAQLLADTDKFGLLADKIQAMIDKADSTFDGLSVTQSQFLTEQKQNVSELSKNMTELLSDYAAQANTQTSEHLAVWSTSTSQYAQQMNSAVMALSNVVDEIQVKVGA